jgi:hypothetical protein
MNYLFNIEYVVGTLALLFAAVYVLIWLVFRRWGER